MRRKFGLKDFKQKINVHPLIFMALRKCYPLSDEELTNIFKEGCELIQNAHKPSNKNKKQKNDNYPQEQNNCWNVIGNDPNVKSMAKKIPARVLFSEGVIKITHKMQMFNFIDSKHIITFAQKLSRLDKFECPPDLLDDEFIKLVPYFTHINVLKFFKCKEITDKSLSYLANNWPKEGRKMNEIVLYGCEKVTNEGVKQLLNSFNDIKVLILSGSGLTPEVMEFIGSTCSKLKRLFLGITGNLWDRNVVKIKNVNDSGVEALSKGCKQLTRLNLNHCINVTDRSIQHLAQYSEHLANLEIFGCNKITLDGLVVGQKIREKCGFASLKSITFNDGRKDKSEAYNEKYNRLKENSKCTKLHNYPEPEVISQNINTFCLPKTVVSAYG